MDLHVVYFHNWACDFVREITMDIDYICAMFVVFNIDIIVSYYILLVK